MNPRDSGEQRVFAADLHIHSALSPCAGADMTPQNVLERLMSLETDIFAVTDHNSWFNCAAFDEAARDRDILFIPGIELQSSEEIHLLGYFPDIGALKVFYTTTVAPAHMRGVKNHKDRFGEQLKLDAAGECIGEEDALLAMPLGLTAEELVAHIHNYEGVAVAAHIDRGFSVVSQLGFIPPGLDIDAVEIQDVTKIDSLSAVYLKDRPLNVLSSSDCHHIDMMGKARMSLRLESHDVRCCLDCIKGEGPDRIHIRRPPSKSASVIGGPSGDKDAGGSKEGWKGLYGRG